MIDRAGTRRGLLLAVVLASLSSLVVAADEASSPKAAILRLAPSSSMKLPAAFVSSLRRQGCTIPQPLSDELDGKRANFISGSFARHGQIDHAVLCSQSGESHIQVFWGGSARCPSRFALGDDQAILGEAGPDAKLGYARAIDPASQKTIAYFAEVLGGPGPPDRKHAGINDSYLGKYSVIHYCTRGSWVLLQGMD